MDRGAWQTIVHRVANSQTEHTHTHTHTHTGEVQEDSQFFDWGECKDSQFFDWGECVDHSAIHQNKYYKKELQV